MDLIGGAATVYQSQLLYKMGGPRINGSKRINGFKNINGSKSSHEAGAFS